MDHRSPLTATLGGSIFGLTGFALIALQLTGAIHWPWWLVTLPLWGLPASVLVLFGGFSLFLAAWCRWQLLKASPALTRVSR